MSKNFFLSFLCLFLFTFIITLFIVCFSNDLSSPTFDGIFIWPIPNYTHISSYFGNRQVPTVGASSFHSGIDIPAPAGTNILSVCSGVVTFASWGAGGGYTIVVQYNNDTTVSYCHVSPSFIIHKGDAVSAGQIISSVGPKNIYDIINNPYKDSAGNPTNGSTTGTHLHLSIKKDGIAVNPLEYFSPIL